MAEDTTTEKTTDDAQQQDANGKTDEQRIPYARFEEVNKRAKQAEQELSDMRQKIIEFEDRDKSEVDRERAARERAESQLGELLGKVTSLEKGAWVRSAAAEANFHDPEDAVAHLMGQLGDVDDQRGAKRLVKMLAGQKEHLVKQEKKERQNLSRVFQGDQVQAQNGQQGQGQQVTPGMQQAAAEQQFAEGLREQLSKFLPENNDNWYDAAGGS